MNNSYDELVSLFGLLEEKNIPIGVKTLWREREQKVKQLSKLVRYDVNMNDFRDFMDTKTMNNTVKQAKKFLKIFVISRKRF